MPAYQVVMDDDGRLFVATKGPKHTTTWERAPMTPAGMTRHAPIDALAVPVELPSWAVDAYLLFPSDAQAIQDMANV